jgi:tripartite-type tricarboxylate transporter receptor subunit TctC
VPGFEVGSWIVVGIPSKTPADIVDKVNGAINAALADPKTKARAAELGGAVFLGAAADFTKLVAVKRRTGRRS